MKSHAILIANGSFPEFPELGALDLPRNDLLKLEKKLRDSKDWGFNVIPLIDMPAREISDKIADVLHKSNSDDLIVIHYSGHGLTNREASKLSLATIDTKAIRTPQREIGFDSITTLLQSRGKTRVLILLDCCHSGAAGTEVRGEPGTREPEPGFLQAGFKEVDEIRGEAQHEESDGVGSGVYVMTACSPNQIAAGRNGHGLFTAQILKAIDDTCTPVPGTENKALTVRSLYALVREGLRSSEQTPMLFVRGSQVANDLVVIPKGLPYYPTRESDVRRFKWNPTTNRESSHLRQVSPVYLLDSKFRMKDWNASFDDLIARPHGLSRGQHAGDFLKHLNNSNAVNLRTTIVFIVPSEDEQKRCEQTGEIPSTFPPVDVERFDYHTQRFGYVRFDKIATQIYEENLPSMTWCVNLSIRYCEREDDLWAHLKEIAMREIRWSKYAESYDEIIGDYPEYQKLVELIVAQVGNSEECLDLGAGTGNTTIALHNKAQVAGRQRRVTAIDTNEEMLFRLGNKLEANEALKQNTTVVKSDAVGYLRNFAQERKRQEKEADFFDACIMLNVLFVLDEPIECLTAIRHVLKPGGILSVSTPREGTDVHHLFRCIERHYKDKGSFPQIKQAFDRAYERNKELIPYATKDTVQDIRGYITQAGFSIETELDHQYDDCVIVIKAKKPRTKAGRRRPAHDPINQ